MTHRISAILSRLDRLRQSGQAKDLFFRPALAIVALLSMTSHAWPINHMRVDTISNVAPNTTGLQIGVWFTNDIPITGFTLPLEIRTWSGGAYIAGPTLGKGLTAAPSRVRNSPLGDAYDNGADSVWPAAFATSRVFSTPDDVDSLKGRCPRSFFLQDTFPNQPGTIWNTSSPSQPDFTSPDAVLYATVSSGIENNGELVALAPGSDDSYGKPSYTLTCKVGPNSGVFVIDTTCVSPANHLIYVDDADTVHPVPVTFTLGIVGVGVTAAVREISDGSVPSDYSLEQNYPNPFNAGTLIRFSTPVDGDVTLDVFNILGQKVRTLVNEFRSAGLHQVDWDGTNDNGRPIATGVYFYRISTFTFTTTRKMVMIK